MKEQLVCQLKTQIADLERFINYLQGEVSTETLACTCACPVHAGGSSSTAYGSKRRYDRGKPIEEELGDDNRTRTLNTVRKVVALLHMFLMSQLGCGSERVRRKFGGNNNKNSLHNWRDLRTRLDIAVEHVLGVITEVSQQQQQQQLQRQRHPDDEEDDDVENDNENDYTSDSDSATSHANAKLTSAVRKHLAISIRDLMQHGLTADVQRATSSVVPFVGCFPQRTVTSANLMHAWELILKYYEVKNGRRYNSSPAQKLSQSFNLDLAAGRIASSKQVRFN